jgi:glycerol-3-phosphate acyltransferase PlsY
MALVNQLLRGIENLNKMGTVPILLWTVLGFLCGSLPFSVWLGKLVGKADVRGIGDGNPGAVNAWRAGGWKAGFPSLLLDFLKGGVPVGLAHHWAGLTGWEIVPVALAPIFGHAFSPFLKFRGGKAITVTFGVWSGLTLWVGPTILGLSLSLAVAFNRTDAWSAVFGILVLGGYLLLSGAPLTMLSIWGVNAALIILKSRKDLKNPPMVRPWLKKIIKGKGID